MGLPGTLVVVSRVAERSKLSPDEYLAWEREQHVRHEYFRGEVFAMAGGSMRHNALCSNVNAALVNALRERGCVVLTSDQRVGAGERDRYVYPDVSVVCGAVRVEPGTSDVLANPTIIVEVLSSSTEQYDRGLKWDGYQRLESLTDFLLVSQSEPHIELFRRDGEGAWLYRSARGGEDVMLSNGVALNVEAIFAETMHLPGD